MFLVYGFVYVLKSSIIIHLQTKVPNDYRYVCQLIIREVSDKSPVQIFQVLYLITISICVND